MGLIAKIKKKVSKKVLVGILLAVTAALGWNVDRETWDDLVDAGIRVFEGIPQAEVPAPAE